MCTTTPSRSIHWDDRIGAVVPGKRADLTILGKDDGVAAVIRDATVLYRADPSAF